MHDNVFVFPGLDNLCLNALDTLCGYRYIAVRAVLHSELDEQQAHKVIDFGHGGDGTFTAAAASALFYCNGWRYAENSIDIGACCRLYKLSGVGVE